MEVGQFINVYNKNLSLRHTIEESCLWFLYCNPLAYTFVHKPLVILLYEH